MMMAQMGWQPIQLVIRHLAVCSMWLLFKVFAVVIRMLGRKLEPETKFPIKPRIGCHPNWLITKRTDLLATEGASASVEAVAYIRDRAKEAPTTAAAEAEACCTLKCPPLSRGGAALESWLYAETWLNAEFHSSTRSTTPH